MIVLGKIIFDNQEAASWLHGLQQTTVVQTLGSLTKS